MKRHFFALSGLTLALSLTACGEKKSSTGYGNTNQVPNQQQPYPQNGYPQNGYPQNGGPQQQGPQQNGYPQNGGPQQQNGNGGINSGPTPSQGGPSVNQGGNGPRGPIDPIQNGGNGGGYGNPPNRGPQPAPANGGNLPPGRGGGRGAPASGSEIEPPVSGGSLPTRGPRPTSVVPATVEANLPDWHAPDTKGTPAEAWLYHVINPALKVIDRNEPFPTLLKTRVQVTLAIGYFDGSGDVDFRYNGRNYGRHAAVDPFLRAAVEDVLAAPCRSPRTQLCGFELINTNDVESFYRREGIGGIVQEVRVLSGAISTEHADNIGRDAQEQLRRSERAEQAFMKAFEYSEAVIYVGHSRQGGGPDFRPPRLKGTKVDFASYEKDRPGAKRTLTAVGGKNRRTRSLALLSCDSTEFFLGEIAKAGPDLEIVTSKGEVEAQHLLMGGLAATELFLRQASFRGLKQFVSNVPVISDSLSLRLPSRTQR